MLVCEAKYKMYSLTFGIRNTKKEKLRKYDGLQSNVNVMTIKKMKQIESCRSAHVVKHT